MALFLIWIPDSFEAQRMLNILKKTVRIWEDHYDHQHISFGLKNSDSVKALDIVYAFKDYIKTIHVQIYGNVSIRGDQKRHHLLPGEEMVE